MLLLGNDDISGSASGQAVPPEATEVLEKRCGSLPVKDFHNPYQGIVRPPKVRLAT
jgi:hypothetical protein